MSIDFVWRGDFENAEVNLLHAYVFETPVDVDDNRDWRSLVERHSLGWVTARDGGRLVGFVNVVWDGHAHAWIQDTMVSSASRNRGIGTRLIIIAREGSRQAGCEWLHVDFGDELGDFYYQACGFAPTSAGLIRLE
jgi:GNAT superfamily N-acetyltransferase